MNNISTAKCIRIDGKEVSSILIGGVQVYPSIDITSDSSTEEDL